MYHSDSISEIASALLAVQQEMKPVVKNSVADIEGRRYSYASLGAILKDVLPILGKNGLVVSQGGNGSNLPGTLELQTTIIHKSGEFISGTFTIPYGGNSPQKAGSAITYARRYGLASMLGIVSDEDDDGALASATEKPTEKKPAPKAAQKAKPQPKSVADKSKTEPAEDRSSEELKEGAIKSIKACMDSKKSSPNDAVNLDMRVEKVVEYSRSMKEKGKMTDTDFRNVQDFAKVYFNG